MAGFNMLQNRVNADTCTLHSVLTKKKKAIIACVWLGQTWFPLHLSGAEFVFSIKIYHWKIKAVIACSVFKPKCNGL